MRSGARGCGAIQVASQPFIPSRTMANTLIDPRPLEPSWVHDTEPSDIADWTIRRRFWNKTTKRMDTVVEGGSGNTLAFLSTLAAILNSRNYECEINVHAGNLVPREGNQKPLYFDLKYPSGYDLGIFWSVSPILGGTEEGYCTDELFDWVEYLLDENKSFDIELSESDPTP